MSSFSDSVWTNRRSTRIAERDESTLSSEDLGAQFSAVFAGHRAFEALYHGAHRTGVIWEVFGAVLDGDFASLALEFVVGRFVGVLEAAPAAYVVDEDRGEVGGAAVDDAQEFLQRVAAVDANAALARVCESADDEQAVFVRISLDGGVLIFRRVLLVFGGHADVFCGPDGTGRCRTRWALATF